MPTISKIEAARRQLNAAIRLFFSGDDPIIVHSLASTAANLYSDLVERTTNNESWRSRYGNDNERAQREVKSILNHAWNFFKHADRDATGELDFDEEQTELMLFHAILECGELETTSDEAQLFQVWYLRTGRFKLELTGEIEYAATLLFPDLPTLDRSAQISKGLARLLEIQHPTGKANI